MTDSEAYAAIGQSVILSDRLHKDFNTYNGQVGILDRVASGATPPVFDVVWPNGTRKGYFAARLSLATLTFVNPSAQQARPLVAALVVGDVVSIVRNNLSGLPVKYVGGTGRVHSLDTMTGGYIVRMDVDGSVWHAYGQDLDKAQTGTQATKTTPAHPGGYSKGGKAWMSTEGKCTVWDFIEGRRSTN